MSTRNLQIASCRGSRVRVKLKNGSILHGTLAFYNYEQQVIHLENFELENKESVDVKGDFWVVNSKAWDNLIIERVENAYTD